MTLFVRCLAAVGLGLVIAWWIVPTARSGSGSTSRPASIQAEPAYLTIDGYRDGEDGRRTVTLINRSRAAITITNLDVGCSACTEVVENPVGRLLQFGESCQLTFAVRPPERSIESRQLFVGHTGQDGPVVVTVQISGRQKPPYIASISPSQLSFFGLVSAGETRTLRVTTFEAVDAPPWIQGIGCDLPEIAVVPAGDPTDERVGGLAKRTYEYRVGWTRVPASPEFHGKVRIVTTAGTEDAIKITGTVAQGK